MGDASIRVGMRAMARPAMGPIGVPFLPGWSYRKTHEIDGTTAGAQIGYQIRLSVNVGPGTDDAENVYLGNKSRTDLGDLRFTEDDGVTELDYWIAGSPPYTKIDVWVKVASIPASPAAATIYVYYGKADAETTASRSDTFEFTDAFDTDTSALYNKTAWKGATGVVHVMTWNAAGWMVLTKGVAAGSGMFTRDGTSYGAGYGIMCRIRLTGGNPNEQIGPGIRGAATDDLTAMASNYVSSPTYNKFIRIFRGSGGSDYNLAYDWTYGFPVATWKTLTLGMTADAVVMHVDHVEELRADFAMEDGEAGVFTYLVSAGQVLWDSIDVRRFADPEPSHGAWGAEEEA